jgi:hypothetical protein
MAACSPEHLRRRQVPALYPKDRTAPGKRGFPGYFEIDAFQAIRGPEGGVFYIVQGGHTNCLPQAYSGFWHTEGILRVSLKLSMGKPPSSLSTLHTFSPYYNEAR